MAPVRETEREHWRGGMMGEGERALEGWSDGRGRESTGGMERWAREREHWRDGVMLEVEGALEEWSDGRGRESTGGME